MIACAVPTFAMHSIREMAESDNAYHLYKALKGMFKDTASRVD